MGVIYASMKDLRTLSSWLDVLNDVGNIVHDREWLLLIFVPYPTVGDLSVHPCRALSMHKYTL
jgi:hypothetical protein